MAGPFEFSSVSRGHDYLWRLSYDSFAQNNIAVLRSLTCDNSDERLSRIFIEFKALEVMGKTPVVFINDSAVSLPDGWLLIPTDRFHEGVLPLVIVIQRQ